MRYSTLCSGTDCPVLAINRFFIALRDLAVDSGDGDFGLTAAHEFAFESHPQKRAFLAKMMPQAPLIFENISGLEADAAKEYLSGDCRLVPEVEGTISGFPCTDVARLSSVASRSGNRSCVASESMRTGGVFAAMLRYIMARRSNFRWLIFENVQDLDKGRGGEKTNLDVCCERLRSLRFSVIVWFVDSRDLGQPHSRARVYIVCLCLSMLAEGGMTEDAAASQIIESMSRFAGHSPVSLDDCLLPESHPLVLGHYRRLDAAVSTHKTSIQDSPPRKRHRRSNGASKHCEFFQEHGLDWTLPSPYKDPKLAEVFPGIRDLHDRQIDVLQKLHIRLPEAQPVCVDLSMSLGWAKKTLGRYGCFSA